MAQQRPIVTMEVGSIHRSSGVRMAQVSLPVSPCLQQLAHSVFPTCQCARSRNNIRGAAEVDPQRAASKPFAAERCGASEHLLQFFRPLASMTRSNWKMYYFYEATPSRAFVALPVGFVPWRFSGTACVVFQFEREEDGTYQSRPGLSTLLAPVKARRSGIVKMLTVQMEMQW